MLNYRVSALKAVEHMLDLMEAAREEIQNVTAPIFTITAGLDDRVIYQHVFPIFCEGIGQQLYLIDLVRIGFPNSGFREHFPLIAFFFSSSLFWRSHQS